MKTLKVLAVTLAICIVLTVIAALITPPVAKRYIVPHSKEMIGRQIHLR